MLVLNFFLMGRRVFLQYNPPNDEAFERIALDDLLRSYATACLILMVVSTVVQT